MQPVTLGTFDVAVDGGGVAGFVRAMHDAGLGRKVVIIEPRGSLMREATRAGLSYFPDDGGEAPNSFRRFTEELRQHGGWRGQTLDLPRTEYVAERMARQLGIAVLYHARALRADGGAAAAGAAGAAAASAATAAAAIADPPDGTAHAIVLKGKLGILRADTFIGGEQLRPKPTAASLPKPLDVWTLTWANAPVTGVKETSAALDGRLLPVRLRPGFHENTAVTDIVFERDPSSTVCAELLFNSRLGDIARLLRSQLAELEHAQLIHAGDEPFPLLPAAPVANGVWTAVNCAAMDLFRLPADPA